MTVGGPLMYLGFSSTPSSRYVQRPQADIINGWVCEHGALSKLCDVGMEVQDAALSACHGANFVF